MARRRRLDPKPTKTAAKAVATAAKRKPAPELALKPSEAAAPLAAPEPAIITPPSTPDLPWAARYPSRIRLGLVPTPIEKLERLSRELGGPEIYVKRDDQTGLATGGNKTRKLEFLLADARAQGCTHIVTMGGPQSNHVRQTAAAAARLGFDCTLVLRGSPPEQPLGNLLLDELFGARLHWAGRKNREAIAYTVMAQLREMGVRPYLVPLGGSNALGTVAYVHAMEEALDQLNQSGIRMDAMVVASSSAGTQAGIVLGAALRKYEGRVLGISIDATRVELSSRIRILALDACDLVGAEVEEAQLQVEVNDRYLGGGYAVVGELEREAIRLVARTEGLLLDPVYTGRAMGALIDLIRKKSFFQGQNVLFWHTGGTAALSAFSQDLLI